MFGTFRNWVIDVEARVSDGMVYVRKQEWLPFAAEQIVSVPDQLRTLDVCKHVSDFREKHAGWIVSAEKQIRHIKVLGRLPVDSPDITPDSDGTFAHTKLAACRYCHTEYRLDFGLLPSIKPRKGHRGQYAVIMTKWMCLGNGVSREGDHWHRYRTRAYDSVEHFIERGSIVERFEGQISSYRPVWTETLANIWGMHNEKSKR